MKGKLFLNIKNFEKNINIGFFKKKGGVSKGKFASLNCSNNCGDKKINVKKNIEICLRSLNIPNKKLIMMNQIHSDKIHIIKNKKNKFNLIGDGIFTDIKDYALGVLTADCAPIFIFDSNYKFICSLHSGWKGTLKNIVKNAVELFVKNKIKKKDIIVIIGPCLGKENFETKNNFKNKFLKVDKNYIKFFKYKNTNKDLFDMRGLINYQLDKLKIQNVYNIRKDTYSNSRLFFSHRRSCHKLDKQTGRMLNIISFQE